MVILRHIGESWLRESRTAVLSMVGSLPEAPQDVGAAAIEIEPRYVQVAIDRSGTTQVLRLSTHLLST